MFRFPVSRPTDPVLSKYFTAAMPQGVLPIATVITVESSLGTTLVVPLSTRPSLLLLPSFGCTPRVAPLGIISSDIVTLRFVGRLRLHPPGLLEVQLESLHLPLQLADAIILPLDLVRTCPNIRIPGVVVRKARDLNEININIEFKLQSILIHHIVNLVIPLQTPDSILAPPQGQGKFNWT